MIIRFCYILYTHWFPHRNDVCVVSILRETAPSCASCLLSTFTRLTRAFFTAGGGGVMVLNATFNKISVLSWRSVLLVEETRVPGEIHRPAANHWQTISQVHLAMNGIRLTTLVVIDTDCIGSCYSNYQTITTTTASSLPLMIGNRVIVLHVIYSDLGTAKLVIIHAAFVTDYSHIKKYTIM